MMKKKQLYRTVVSVSFLVLIFGFFSSVKLEQSDTKGVKKHYVGEFFGGGLVAHVDESGYKGLIVSLQDMEGRVGFSNVINKACLAQDGKNGFTNTTKILKQVGHLTSAAKLCSDYKAGGFNDWYLPSYQELRLLYANRRIIKDALDKDKRPQTIELSQYYYWSSTEFDAQKAWYMEMFYGKTLQDLKSVEYKVRAVRTFGGFQIP